ncbi:MAG TPA: thiopeptide-type bacteriocin biosynthesis protein [Longimicrobiaceae bacterium]|nr:thiopeptide-type bacteriocin biosynthesis protein [Longimicrobiaceae bacterium]
MPPSPEAGPELRPEEQPLREPMPPLPDPGNRWLSAYLFFGAGIYTGECDRVVLEVVEPFVRRCLEEGWIDRHFFIRYSEWGSHVRLRLHGAEEAVEERVWPALQAHVAALHPEVAFEKPEPVEGAPRWFPPTQGGSSDVTHLLRVEYEPEVERYGGPEGVRLAERFFEHSSEAAYALLKKTHPTERASRLGKGLLCMVVLAHAFNDARGRAADFAHQYGINYLRSLVRDEGDRSAWLGAFGSGYDQQAEMLGEYVDEVWLRMDEGEELSEALDAYHAGLREVRGAFRGLVEEGKMLTPLGEPFASFEAAAPAITSSYWHMMNNRLGVTVQEESYLAYLIMRALGRPADAVSA